MPVGSAAPVAIAHVDGPLLRDASRGAGSAAKSGVAGAIEFARAIGSRVPVPGEGRTADHLSALATVGAVDLAVARVVEPHLDALAILHQAGSPAGVGVYGVYASELPELEPVQAVPRDGGTALVGRKPWCSLAGSLDRALITATQHGERRLFDIDLHDSGAWAIADAWVSEGRASVGSGELDLDHVPASPVGPAGWYLTRPGFAWSGIGIAACWFGGAVGLARALLRAADRCTPDRLTFAAIGEADQLIWAARNTLADAAVRIDAGQAVGVAGALLADRVRGVVAHAAEQILLLVDDVLGSAPLTFDEEHARRVADLAVALRQHHPARDDVRAGATLLANAEGWA